jgi:phosphatidylinositol 3,5-bisphosphate 5-phosphatase
VTYNEQRTVYRLLKLDRTVVKPQLLADILTEDPNLYDKKTLMAMLDMINEGNRSTGGLVKVATAVGLVGFVRFFDQFYLTVITQRKKVATVGNNIIYTIKGTETIPIRPKEDSEGKFFHSMWNKLNKKLNQTPIDVAESRYLGLFQFIDMTKDFYFSYTYGITHSLQYNYSTQSCKLFPSPPANVCLPACMPACCVCCIPDTQSCITLFLCVGGGVIGNV